MESSSDLDFWRRKPSHAKKLARHVIWKSNSYPSPRVLQTTSNSFCEKVSAQNFIHMLFTFNSRIPFVLLVPPVSLTSCICDSADKNTDHEHAYKIKSNVKNHFLCTKFKLILIVKKKQDTSTMKTRSTNSHSRLYETLHNLLMSLNRAFWIRRCRS